MIIGPTRGSNLLLTPTSNLGENRVLIGPTRGSNGTGAQVMSWVPAVIIGPTRGSNVNSPQGQPSAFQ